MSLQKLRERHNPTVVQLLEFLYESPVFSGADKEMLADGLTAYQEEDFVKAVHVLIPQIERLLRALLTLMGIPTSKLVRGQPGIMQLKNINDILSDQRVRKSLGENLWRYLQVFLADKRGINLRNRVAHGLLNVKEFNRPVADQVFHALLALGLIREAAKAEEIDSA